jgi:hypothetical protein
MSKQSKRPGRAARDVHARIREQADAVRRATRFGVRDADETPELAALMTSARRAIEAAMPATFEHEGRTFYLCTRLALQLDIFDTPGTDEPLMRGAVFSAAEFGHAPGH